jgi:hypothetical protein
MGASARRGQLAARIRARRSQIPPPPQGVDVATEAGEPRAASGLPGEPHPIDATTSSSQAADPAIPSPRASDAASTEPQTIALHSSERRATDAGSGPLTTDVLSTELLASSALRSAAATPSSGSNGASPSSAIASSGAAATRPLAPRPLVPRDAPEETTMPSAMPTTLQGMAGLVDPAPAARPPLEARPIVPPAGSLDDDDSFAGLDADPWLPGDPSPSSAPAGRARLRRISEPSPLEKALEAVSDAPPAPSAGTLAALADTESSPAAATRPARPGAHGDDEAEAESDESDTESDEADGDEDEDDEAKADEDEDNDDDADDDEGDEDDADGEPGGDEAREDALAGKDDDLDESFFSEPAPDVQPHHEIDDEASAHDPRAGERASLIEARRARSRRTVTWVVGAAGLLIGVAVAARMAGTGRAPPRPTVDTRPPTETVAEAPALPPPSEPPMGSAAIAVGAPGEPGHLAAPPPEASAQPSELAPSAAAQASAAAAVAAPNAADVAESEPAPAASSPGIGDTGPATPRDPARAKELTRQVLDLLHRTKNAEAVEMAEQAIAADPTDAMSYLYLGAALQELGREADARAAYDRCVRDATRNGFDQCRALGGRKKR